MLAGLPAVLRAGATPDPAPRQNYVLYCGGCHGLEGVSNSRLVPDLRDQAGYFLNLPEGRRYLVRLPNVAFSTTTDEELSELINYVAFELGGAGAPPAARRYTPREVARLRRRPLTETSLAQLRQRMVATLIDQHHATTDLRRYGPDDHERPSSTQER